MTQADVDDLVKRRIAQLDGAVKPRLRFDKVALRFVRDVHSALDNAVPDGKTAIVTVTAPIRQASKTAAELEEKIRTRLQRDPPPSEIREVIHGNDIRVRIVNRGSNQTPSVIGFVHNPEPGAAETLLDLAQSSI